MTHVFAEPGTVTMQCKDDAETGQVLIHFVEITAVKAGTLQNVAL